MNEKIKSIALECYKPYGNFDLDKFAELIIREYTQEYQKLVDGHSVVLPKNREHAENMVRVGMFYLENN